MKLFRLTGDEVLLLASLGHVITPVIKGVSLMVSLMGLKRFAFRFLFFKVRNVLFLHIRNPFNELREGCGDADKKRLNITNCVKRTKISPPPLL